MKFATYLGLKDKIALVTGCASGTGVEIVKAFADQGTNVGFLDLDENANKELLANREGNIAFEACDLREIDKMRAGLAKLQSSLGPAQILGNPQKISFIGPISINFNF